MPQTKNTGSNLAGNKDLSCLRCRKKKAKCSKTRPACTRCARSNQLCEYPDAPPNLSDLSQKVLGLYDTLRKLEDTFVTQYGSNLLDNNDQEPTGYNSSRASSEMPSIETLSIHQPAKRLKTAPTPTSASIIDEGALPGNWSMTLTSEGLTLHAVTRNIIEFTSFAKDFSQQLQYNNQTDTKLWEWFDDEPVDDDDDDPLDEDEYLVTVPVYATASLLRDPSIPIHLDDTISINDSLYEHISPHISNMLTHLRQMYGTLDDDDFSISHIHITTLLLHMRPFVSLDEHDPMPLLARFCLCTAYAASTIYLRHGVDGSSLVDDCVTYASGLLVELVLQRQTEFHPIIIGAILLTSLQRPRMIHLAARALCASCDWDPRDKKWQQLAALVLYFEAHSSAFYEWQDIGEARNWLLQAASRLSTSEEKTSAALGLEAQLMCLLKQVFALFYCRESGDNNTGMRKVDVDDVLNLVRDIEIWEQKLPQWMQWSCAHNDTDDERSLLLRMHIHMIHSIVKILLFRPFSIPIDHDNDEMQTYTRTTFLDLSMASVDRLSTCLSYINAENDWCRAGRRLGLDVVYRVQQTFPCDEELIHKLEETKKQLQ
ncbi:predicted protein [Lichtheimia corymbifera JMRC:FSU:9682]|uniref:Zn(2)-C6 fungal-type domain-containing protein n=1 Tax=Lichtheimia corymbifera JMRC:FSU:9682 TaxID=1263082 RepID=A0A068SAS1_9FUNG|nr:predicted protein [Lichtheimia corymbifera JMRC:FSU:9682]